MDSVRRPIKFRIEWDGRLSFSCSLSPVTCNLSPVPYSLKCDVHWVDRYRTSSRTHQRHELSGFVGECTYEFPMDESAVSNLESGTSNVESGISNLELLKWILCGELLHVGRHTAWGNGRIQVLSSQQRDNGYI